VERLWWLADHQNGRSEGDAKPVFRFEQLYTAAWFLTYGEVLLYYPPVGLNGHPFTLNDVLGPVSDTHEAAFVAPNLPANDPEREAKFSAPYPDIALPGLALITAMAPVYYTGEWYNYTYDDTYLGTVGIDIKVQLLSELEGTLTYGSFAFLVDSAFHMFVISASTVGKIYPSRTGFEESRVTYDAVDGSIVEDRRNQTYLPSDTIFQDLTSLTNADWKGLQSKILALSPGEQGFDQLNVTLTSQSDPTLFYVTYDRWASVDDFVLIALVPVSEVENAINVRFLEPDSVDLVLADGETAHHTRNSVTFANEGTLDVMVSLVDLPSWITLVQAAPDHQVVKAGDTLVIEFDVLADRLEPGTSNERVTLSVEDASYPDCTFSREMGFEVTVERRVKTAWFATLGIYQGLVLAAGAILIIVLSVVLYKQKKHNRDDALWKVQKKDLVFCDPPEVIGHGTFGLILKAEYRGTQVAVKRIMPPKTVSSRGTPNIRENKFQSAIVDGSKSVNGSNSNLGVATSPTITTGASGSTGKKMSQGAQWKKSRSDFIEEMEYVSKLRHPCITTVMGTFSYNILSVSLLLCRRVLYLLFCILSGGIIAKNEEPMLIMEFMEYGSLYDILHNETMPIDAELLLPILRDISQGMRFLHAAEPPVIHGDLKAKNILVDSKFRAKVSDFGLSQKTNVGGTGTPYWMAPELLRGETTNTMASDVYSFGILLFEVYARRDPYEGENSEEVLLLVADTTMNKRPPIPKSCPTQVQSLMTDSLVTHPQQRPSFGEVDERLKRVDLKTLEETSLSLREGTDKNATISLFDIFPKHIAEALRDGKKVEPEHKDCVTIFFCDIVGYTDISSTLDPRKIANMLDRLYNKFDELSHKHDVFKVRPMCGPPTMPFVVILLSDHCPLAFDYRLRRLAMRTW
jgi:serine/threonine protein kinase